MNISPVGSVSSLYQTAGLSDVLVSAAPTTTTVALSSANGSGDTIAVTHLPDGSSISTKRTDSPPAAVIAVTTTPAAASPYVAASSASYGVDVSA